jgi:hypothetical protein
MRPRREFPAKVKVAEDFDYLSERLSYDPETGLLRWKIRPRRHFASDMAWRVVNSRNGGKTAGSLSKAGYITVRVDGKLLYAHRIAWVLCSGEAIPEGMVIDHANCTKSDNRFGNLRLATAGQNGHNQQQKLSRNLPKGVHYDKSKQRYVGYVTIDGKQHFAGRFDTIDETDAAVRLLREDLHGDFCRHGGRHAS